MSAAAGSGISRRGVWRAAALTFAVPLLAACDRGPGESPRSATSTLRSTGTPAAMWRGATTVRDGDLVVRGTVTQARLRAVATAASTAIARVRAVWGDAVLQGELMIEVPRDDAQFRARGGSAEAGAQLAATTTTDGRVVLAPTLFRAVTPAGRVVVLTHELTHVALHQAGLTGVRRWVVEGSAEFTAYHASTLSPPRLAPQVARRVRAGDAPTGPPDDARFADDPQAAYQEAYAWCLFLVDRFGLRRFVDFVRAADAHRAGAFSDAFGTSVAALRTPYADFLRARFTDRQVGSPHG